FPGTRNAKWCHFVRDTADAPSALAKRSEAAGLPKDRAAVSFVFAENTGGAPKAEKPAEKLAVRIISDEIALPGGRKGRYACSRWGALLLTGRQLKNIKSGSLVTIKIDDSKKPLLKKDRKTNFLTIDLG
ncbi:MAG: rRNA methyltransferase, partial [Spirochaetaceae bacterium]|nr:rRNA methyltransferase [Spirochaetaceae bacterium]